MEITFAELEGITIPVLRENKHINKNRKHQIAVGDTADMKKQRKRGISQEGQRRLKQQTNKTDTCGVKPEQRDTRGVKPEQRDTRGVKPGQRDTRGVKPEQQVQCEHEQKKILSEQQICRDQSEQHVHPHKLVRQQRLPPWNSCKRCRQKRVVCEEERSSSPGRWKVLACVFKSKMIRITGQCLLLILVASCGGMLMNKIVSEVTDEQLKKFLNSEVYGEVRLRSVSLKTFRRQLAETRSHYDLLRIFYDREGISDSEIDELLNARILKRIPGHLHSRELSPSEDYPDENYQVYGDFTLQDPVPSTVEDIERAYAHIDEMEKSRLADCRYPQPEITHVRTDGDSKHKLYFPECTVVYRCRNISGCCHNASKVCGPKSIEVISKSFFVLEMTGPDSIQPDKVQMVETREFINHTECECQEVKGLPGCNRECPHPFVRMRPGLRCTCDCKDDDIICHEIKVGIKSLPEDLLECIKNEICMKPECDVEEFDIKSGYCPSDLSLYELNKRHPHRHRVHLRSHTQRHKSPPGSHHKKGKHRHDKEISIV